jgi:hypothetical protein
MPRFGPGERQRCPRCETVVRFMALPGLPAHTVAESGADRIRITFSECPNCRHLVLTLEELAPGFQGSGLIYEHTLWPITSGRAPAPAEVPTSIADDYNEAALVFLFSPKASAALSRRCMQAVLMDKAGVKSKDLSSQIAEVLPALPQEISENLDMVRQVGKYAEHPAKAKEPGILAAVEPGEAEWNLDVLEALLDFYYVRPSLEAGKRARLAARLKQTGTPPVAQPS